jgi:hypothetical protein
VQGAFRITRALLADAGEVDQLRVIGRGSQERRERGYCISQPAGCEMGEGEFDAQCLLLEDGDAGDRCATRRDNVVRGAGVRGACAEERSVKAG